MKKEIIETILQSGIAGEFEAINLLLLGRPEISQKLLEDFKAKGITFIKNEFINLEQIKELLTYDNSTKEVTA